MSNVRFGIIGAGNIAPCHIYAIENTEGAELGAVCCGVVPQQAAKLANEHDACGFSSTDEMLNSDLVDAVVVCTPSGYHLDSALKVIEAGKHLLVEKPLEITTDRIDTIISAAKKKGVKIASSLQRRFLPTSLAVKEILDKGILGDIYFGTAFSMWYRTQEYYDSGVWRGTWEVDGGGCLMNQGIHTVDLFLWLMGMPKSLMAMTQTLGRNLEVETLAVAMLDFANGAKGTIHCTTLAYPGTTPSSIEIVGSKGTIAFDEKKVIRFDLIEPTEESEKLKAKIFADQDARAVEEAEKAKNVVPGAPITNIDMGFRPIYREFIDSIKNDREPTINGNEARKSVEVITKIYKSSQNGSEKINFI